MLFAKKNSHKIFIDFDGVVVDISQKYYNIYYEFMIINNLDPLNKKDFWNLKINKKNDSRLINNIGLNSLYRNYFLENIEKREFLQLDSIIAGAREALVYLKDNGYEIYLLTLRRFKENLMWQLSFLDLNNFFIGVLSSNPNLQDSCLNYLEKIKLIDELASTNDIIIGDSTADIKCGKKLNLKTLGVLSGICSEDYLKKLNPDHIIKDISFIKEIL